MKIIKLFFLLLAVSVNAQNQWKVPLNLNDSNTKINFEVDSTWVLVKGSTSGIQGSTYYANLKDPNSLSAEFELPVVNFKTGSDMRDGHMRDVMAAEQFPKVKIKIVESIGDCNPEVLKNLSECLLSQKALITIRDVTKEVQLKSKVVNQGEKYLVTGDIILNWPEYNVGDPSQFFAKLDPNVKIIYSIEVPKK